MSGPPAKTTKLMYGFFFCKRPFEDECEYALFVMNIMVQKAHYHCEFKNEKWVGGEWVSDPHNCKIQKVPGYFFKTILGLFIPF